MSLTCARSSLTVCSCWDQSWEREAPLTPQSTIWASSCLLDSCSLFTCSRKPFKRAFRPLIVWLESCSESMESWESAHPNVYRHTMSCGYVHTIMWHNSPGGADDGQSIQIIHDRWTLLCLLQNTDTDTCGYNFYSKQFATHLRSQSARGVYWVNIYPAKLTWGNVAFHE